MFDNVKLILDLNDIFYDEQRYQWKYNLMKKSKDASGSPENFISGHIKNIKFSTPRDKLIIFGSIAKFLNDENCTPLKRKDVEAAILKLENRFEIDLSKSKLTCVEFGPSIVVNENPCRYLNLFGWPPRLKRYIVSSYTKEILTITYESETGFQEFILYNKIKEMEDKGMGCKKKEINMPIEYIIKNVIRMEYKIKKSSGIIDKFGRELSAHDLYDKSIYCTFQKMFLDFYSSIEKNGRTIYLNNSRTPKQFVENFYERQRHLHPDEFNEYNQEVIESGIMKSKDLSFIRSKDRKRSQNIRISNTAPLIAELDMKINEAIAADNS